MSQNPYLDRKRQQFETTRAQIEGIQNRAVEEDRDMTEDELRSVTEQGALCDTLAREIELVTAQENRAVQVATMGANLRQMPEEVRASSTYARDRDPGHYRSVSEGGHFSFFQDIDKAHRGDVNSRQRLEQHNRALTAGGEGVGIVPPRWMTELWTPSLRQGRNLANAIRKIDLGSDPRPITIPKQTVGITVAENVDTCGTVSWTDSFDTDVDTVTPSVVAGGQIVCRSFLDSATPSVDQLIFQDLTADYDRMIEAKIGNAIITAAGAATTTFATEAAFNAAGAAYDAVIDAGMAVWAGRKLPADLVVMRVRRWGSFLKLKDSAGRPLFPTMNGGAQAVNVFGVGDVKTPGMIDGLAAVVTEGVGTTAYPESMVVQRAEDALLFESSQLRFEDPYSVGPDKVRLAIWGYAATYVRYPSLSGKRVAITAA